MTSWDSPQTVSGFARSGPNLSLMQYAEQERARGAARVLDIGCGAARNAVPLARNGWEVVGTDTSWPMLSAGAQRAIQEARGSRILLAAAPMDRLPVPDHSFDLIVAHGIWNLARSAAEFRAGVREAARAARPKAGLFLFTFSRSTLPPGAQSVPNEPFVFTQFSGEPQCFLTGEQIVAELTAAGFVPDPAMPLKELNRPAGLQAASGPVIYEGAFRRT